MGNNQHWNSHPKYISFFFKIIQKIYIIFYVYFLSMLIMFEVDKD